MGEDEGTELSECQGPWLEAQTINLQTNSFILATE